MNLEYLRTRFWVHVAIGEPEADWPWLLSVGGHGYGQFWDGESVVLAHRVAWELTYGPVGMHESPSGLMLPNRIRHRCPDGPLRICCNPRHLVEGSDKDNADDRADDGNTYRGSMVTIAKLDEDKVKAARLVYASGETITEVARRFGVSRTTMRSALRGETWAHVG